jgi:hypothetical protein
VAAAGVDGWLTAARVCRCCVSAGKWARGGWAGSDQQELQVKEETQVREKGGRCFDAHVD